MAVVEFAVKNPSLGEDESLKVTVDAAGTLADIKASISKQFPGNPAPDQLTVIYAGRVLRNDAATIQEFIQPTIDERALPTLHVVIKAPPAGAPHAGAPSSSGAPAEATAGSDPSPEGAASAPAPSTAPLMAATAPAQLAAGLEGAAPPPPAAPPPTSADVALLEAAAMLPAAFAALYSAAMGEAVYAAYASLVEAAQKQAEGEETAATPEPTSSTAAPERASSTTAPEPASSTTAPEPASTRLGGTPDLAQQPVVPTFIPAAHLPGSQNPAGSAGPHPAPAAQASSGTLVFPLAHPALFGGEGGPRLGLHGPLPGGAQVRSVLGHLRERAARGELDAPALALLERLEAEAAAVGGGGAGGEGEARGGAGRRGWRGDAQLNLNVRALLQLLVLLVVVYQHCSPQRFAFLAALGLGLYLSATQTVRTLLAGLMRRHWDALRRRAGVGGAGGAEEEAELAAHAQDAAGGEPGPPAAAPRAEGPPLAQPPAHFPAAPAAQPPRRLGLGNELYALVVGFLTSLLPGWNVDPPEGALLAAARQEEAAANM